MKDLITNCIYINNFTCPWCVKLSLSPWRHGVVVITTAQLHSTKPELRFCAGSKPACGALEICDGKNLWQRSRLEIRLITFHRSHVQQKHFIIIHFSYFSTNQDCTQQIICFMWSIEKKNKNETLFLQHSGLCSINMYKLWSGW